MLLLPVLLTGQEHRELAIGQADAIVDLRTHDGATLVHASWKYTNAYAGQSKFKSPGPSSSDPLALYPTGDEIRTLDIQPKAGVHDYDDSFWQVLDPEDLETRRGTGRLSFGWYRLHITIPDQIGDLPTAGSTIVFELVMDDYSEIWVNGTLNKTFGQSGSGVISGFNTRNRVFLTQDAHPGDEYQIAILGINGPIADLPDNYIWIRSATLDIYRNYPEPEAWLNVGTLHVYDAAINQVIDTANFAVTKLAEGFQFTEGPVWHPEGFLLFSDPNTNVIYKYDPFSRNVYVYMTKTGYSGKDIGRYHQPGSNGLAIDHQGRLIVCQHGNRRVIRHETKGPVTVMADRYMGKRLNSPNDVVVKGDNSIYFTDPPYGLPNTYSDPAKELNTQGVYRIANGETQLLTTVLGGPNGLAFSPDERYLYVGNWDIRDIWHTKTVWRFPVKRDGTLGEGEIFFDFNATSEDEAIDGIKVDSEGNLFVSAPGGIWIIAPDGHLLGKVVCPERPANMAWGDDGRTLYLTAHSSLYKLRVKTGIHFPA